MASPRPTPLRLHRMAQGPIRAWQAFGQAKPPAPPKGLSMTTSQKISILFLSFLLFAALALAQAPSATLVGRIVDASNLAVSGASVRVRNTDTNESRMAETQA